MSVSFLLLVGCGSSGKEESLDFQTSGAKSAIYATLNAQTVQQMFALKPSAQLGMYVSMYLGQGSLVNVVSALDGIDAQIRLIRANTELGADETFVLLQEYGHILQVDLWDTLNRSANREGTLKEYARSLDTMNTRIEEKITELSVKLEDLKDGRRDQRKVVRDLEREIRRDLKDQNYSSVGESQKDLTKAKSTLAGIQTRESQTDRIRKIFKSLIKVGIERSYAISQNKKALVAGIRVIEVPGIEELGILLEE